MWLNIISLSVFFVKGKEFEMEKNLRNLKVSIRILNFLLFLAFKINWLSPNFILIISVTLCKCISAFCLNL